MNTEPNPNARGWKEKASDWLVSQGVSTVLLFCILGALVIGGRYAMETAIPSHLRSIQDGYERIDKVNYERREEERKSHEALIRYIVDGMRDTRYARGTE